MYYQTQLKNGIRVIAENIPHFRSISIGVWIGVGSANETKENNGISHFIEHMLFKGTHSKSAKEIAAIMDGVGGQLNAFTAKECTCYYVKVMDEHTDLAFELLSDMLLHSTMDTNEIEKEKGVVLEEISMVEDSPEDLIHELLAESFFNNHPLSFPILGYQQNVRNFTRDDILQYMNDYYTPNNIVISFAGSFERSHMEEKINRYFGDLLPNTYTQEQKIDFIPKKSIFIREKDTEQTHICIGTPGISQASNDEVYPLLILNNLLGGSMSSRLFQKIREEKGLAYSVYSYPSQYKQTGMFTIYAGMKPSQSLEVIQLIFNEIYDVRTNGVKQDELSQAREQLKGNFILGLESTSSRMSAIGKSLLLLNTINSPTQIIEKINSVTMNDLISVVEKVLDTRYINIAAIGKTGSQVEIEKMIELQGV